MDLASLKTFVEVMRQGSFAAVARTHDLDPSSISRIIANLEKELGVRLFQRTTRRLSPTEAGLAYCERVESLVEELQQASVTITDLAGRPSGTLRVTASVSFGLQCIVPHLALFEAQYPDLNIDLVLTDAVIDLFAERIDLAIRLGRLTDSTLIAQPLIKTPYIVCASPSYLERYGWPQHPAEIAQHNCLRFPLRGFRSHWQFRDRTGKVEQVPVTGRTVVSTAMGLRDCAIAGMGLALLAHWLVDSDLAADRLVPVLPQFEVTARNFDSMAWMVYPSRRYIPLKVQAFMEHLKETLISTYRQAKAKS